MSNSYTSASTLGFFIPDRSIYSLPCHAGNQYKYWSEAFVKQVKQGDIKKIAYVDFSDSVACAKQFFNQCTLVSHTVEEKVVPILNKSKGNIIILLRQGYKQKTIIMVLVKYFSLVFGIITVI